MSRGFGKLQNAILGVFESCQKLDTLTLATRVFGAEASEVTESQLVSLRRALRLLETKGRIFPLGRREDRIQEWANERYGLYVEIRRTQRELACSLNEASAIKLRAAL